ncbi:MULTISPECIES: hypothetical protein, partial [unclassified Roseobacter]
SLASGCRSLSSCSGPLKTNLGVTKSPSTCHDLLQTPIFETALPKSIVCTSFRDGGRHPAPRNGQPKTGIGDWQPIHTKIISPEARREEDTGYATDLLTEGNQIIDNLTERCLLLQEIQVAHEKGPRPII